MERKLKVQVRQDSGKGVARKLRSAGQVPGVVYGQGGDPVMIAVDSRELFHLLHTDAGANVMVDLKLDKDTVLAMPREVQQDHVRGGFIHVDFLRIARDEKVTVEVPIHLAGEAPGVKKEGGVTEHHLWTLQIECLPSDMPNQIDADISVLNLNDSLRVADLKLPANVTVLSPLDETVVSVVPPQVLRVAEEVTLEGEAAEGEAAEGEGTGEESGSDSSE